LIEVKKLCYDKYVSGKSEFRGAIRITLRSMLMSRWRARIK
jgi:hypothetical protein